MKHALSTVNLLPVSMSSTAHGLNEGDFDPDEGKWIILPQSLQISLSARSESTDAMPNTTTFLTGIVNFPSELRLLGLLYV